MRHCCEFMDDKVIDLSNTTKMDDENKIVLYSAKFREYGISVRDGNIFPSSYIVIDFCPWCGKKLPESKRDEWFDELEALGYDFPMIQEIPEKYNSEEWYLKK